MHSFGAYYLWNGTAQQFDLEHGEPLRWNEGGARADWFPAYPDAVQVMTTLDGARHPIVFSANGSHGLWASSGSFRPTTVPWRLLRSCRSPHEKQVFHEVPIVFPLVETRKRLDVSRKSVVLLLLHLQRCALRQVDSSSCNCPKLSMYESARGSLSTCNVIRLERFRSRKKLHQVTPCEATLPAGSTTATVSRFGTQAATSTFPCCRWWTTATRARRGGRGRT